MRRFQSRTARQLTRAALAIATLGAAWLAAGAPLYRYY